MFSADNGKQAYKMTACVYKVASDQREKKGRM